MQAFNFSCPHCSAVLRLRDRAFVGTQVACPDCGDSFLIDLDNQEGVVARREQAEPNVRRGVVAAIGSAFKLRPEVTPSSHPSSELSSVSPMPTDSGLPSALSADALGRIAFGIAALKTPVGVAWTVAVACTISLIVAVSSSESPKATRPAVESVTDNNGSNSNTTADIKAEKKMTPSNEVSRKKQLREIDTLIETQLIGLGHRLKTFHTNNGRFPEGIVQDSHVESNKRFSWLAVLAADFERSKNMQPLWDRPWMDPLNDRFVRQRVPEFHNPAIEQLVAANGYPATHFVGVCGVGADAANLAVTDPRAGVFGFNRRTTLDDIKDGTSNTIMIAGVFKNLGAWASGGRATIRAFSRMPYINGPDGFGTGQSDGMFVLKADGSVQFMSANTEPTIFRRMAAIADGLPLDPSVPGDPGDRLQAVAAAGANRRSSTDQQTKRDSARPNVSAVGNKDPENEKNDADVEKNDAPRESPPVPVVVVPEPAPEKHVDVKAALDQRIVRFAQVKPCPFSQLLMQIEEMAGVPIQYDKKEIDSSTLEQPIALTLKDTTVGGILQAIVRRVGLVHEIQKNGIQIRQPHPVRRD